jgi:hypothetical protein
MGRPTESRYISLTLLPSVAHETDIMYHLGRNFLVATTGIISGASMIERIAGTVGSAAGEAGL